MNIICDTSFLMILCYEPIKNIDILEIKFGKPIFLIHSRVIDELTGIKHSNETKRAKIANLGLQIIYEQAKQGDFKVIDDSLKRNEHQLKGVDEFLLTLAFEKKIPLATIDKNLISRALKKGVDTITLKNNKIFFIASKSRSNLNH